VVNAPASTFGDPSYPGYPYGREGAHVRPVVAAARVVRLAAIQLLLVDLVASIPGSVVGLACLPARVALLPGFVLGLDKPAAAGELEVGFVPYYCAVGAPAVPDNRAAAAGVEVGFVPYYEAVEAGSVPAFRLSRAGFVR
jgi:hypothetical protein